MRDRDMTELLASVDAEVRHLEPDQAFADELFVRLQAETRHTAGWSRTMTLLAAAALLLALLAGAIAVGAALLRWNAATDLVRSSQAVYQNPPPFTMVTTSGDPPEGMPGWYTACEDPTGPLWREIQWQYDYDGAGSFRQACLYGGPPPAYVGAFEVQTPAGHGVWDAASWSLLPPGFLNRPPGAPLVTPVWLNWLEPDGGLIECDAWQLGQVDQVAGRPAQAVSCAANRYWIDQESALLVKREVGGVVIAEVTHLTVGAVPPASAFELHDAGFSTKFRVGEVPIVVTLPHVDSGEWSSDSLRGRPAALLIQTDCHEPEPCLSLGDFVDVVTARSDQINAAAISYAHREAFAEADVAAAIKAGVPVLVDDQTAWPRWEYPSLGVALFETEGRYVGLVEARTRASFTAAVDALLAGTTIPSPPPGDGVFVVGQPAPTLAGTLLGGAAFDWEALRGRPVVVLVPPWLSPRPPSADCPREPLQEGLRMLADTLAAVGDAASFVAIAWAAPMGEPPQFTGWDELIREAGSAASGLLVVGPDPAQETLWTWLRGQVGYCGGSTTALVVLDADGTVQRVIGGTLPSADQLIDLLRDL